MYIQDEDLYKSWSTNVFDINYEKNPCLNSVYKTYVRPNMKHEKQAQQSIEDTRTGLRTVF